MIRLVTWQNGITIGTLRAAREQTPIVCPYSPDTWRLSKVRDYWPHPGHGPLVVMFEPGLSQLPSHPRIVAPLVHLPTLTVIIHTSFCWHGAWFRWLLSPYMATHSRLERFCSPRRDSLSVLYRDTTWSGSRWLVTPDPEARSWLIDSWLSTFSESNGSTEERNLVNESVLGFIYVFVSFFNQWEAMVSISNPMRSE